MKFADCRKFRFSTFLHVLDISKCIFVTLCITLVCTKIPPYARRLLDKFISSPCRSNVKSALIGILKQHDDNDHNVNDAKVPKNFKKVDTVLLLKSFHRRRSFFLFTGCHSILHEFRGYYSMFHQAPIKIFLLNSQKGGQMRQSNHPPLFSRQRSAAHWAVLTNTNQLNKSVYTHISWI